MAQGVHQQRRRFAGAGPRSQATRPRSPREATVAGRRLAALARAVARALGPQTLATRLVGLGLLSAAAFAAGCGGAHDDTFDPRLIQANERLNADAVTPVERPFSNTSEPLPSTGGILRPDINSGTTRPTTIPSGGVAGTDAPIVRMPLREVIQRAVANSSEVRVAGYDPAVNAQKVIQAQAQFDPAYIANVNIQRQSTQTAGTPIVIRPNFTAEVTTNKFNIYSWEGGIQQNLLSGGKASLTYMVDETDYEIPSDFRALNPYWESQIKLQVTQPLLKGFGTQVNAAKITIAKDDQRISTLEFRKTVEDTIDQIEQDYWQLYEAEEEVVFDQQLVNSSLQTYNILLARQNLGVDKDAAGVPTAQAETRVKANQAVLLAAQLHVRDISADLKRRMNDPVFPVSGPVVILPNDKPVQAPVEFNLKEQIDAAMDNRLELGEQQVRVDEAQVLLMQARNGELPQLDLVASSAVQGLQGDYWGALRSQDNFNHISYQFGFQFTLPIGDRGPKAQTRQAQLQRYQAIEQYRNLVGQISLDVQTNWDAVISAYKQAERRQQSRLAAEEEIRLINRQIISGSVKLEPPYVQVQLQAQEDLAEAQRQEALALANYNIAIEKLEKAKGLLLRYDNVILQEDPQIAANNGR